MRTLSPAHVVTAVVLSLAGTFAQAQSAGASPGNAATASPPPAIMATSPGTRIGAASTGTTSSGTPSSSTTSSSTTANGATMSSSTNPTATGRSLNSPLNGTPSASSDTPAAGSTGASSEASFGPNSSFANDSGNSALGTSPGQTSSGTASGNSSTGIGAGSSTLGTGVVGGVGPGTNRAVIIPGDTAGPVGVGGISANGERIGGASGSTVMLQSTARTPTPTFDAAARRGTREIQRQANQRSSPVDSIRPRTDNDRTNQMPDDPVIRY